MSAICVWPVVFYMLRRKKEKTTSIKPLFFNVRGRLTLVEECVH